MSRQAGWGPAPVSSRPRSPRDPKPCDAAAWQTVVASLGDLLPLDADQEREAQVPDAVRVPRDLLACVVMLILLCSPARADGEYSPFRAFGIDEIRLGGMKHNLDVRNDTGGVGYTLTREGGFDVNAEVLFVSSWPQPSNAILDFLFRPRPMLGATVSTQGQTSQVYFGAAWSLPLFDILFLEATFGGAYHDGPLTSTGPNYVEAYGCRFNFQKNRAPWA